MNLLQQLHTQVLAQTDKQKAEIFQRFFKTGKGEYAEGDIFAGLTVPQSRSLAKQFKDLTLAEVEELLHSQIHEERLIALLILIEQFKKGNEHSKKAIYDLYVKSTSYINNWDLVDLSAHQIIGAYLLDKPVDILLKWAKSSFLWERRICIISTFAFMHRGSYQHSLDLAELLLQDKHDLIHKAVGWVLREVGKRDLALEESFLKNHYQTMPRTMLRYAIERFPEEKRQRYLKGKV